MNTVGADSKRDISMSIDKQFGRRRILAKQVYRFACEEFQLRGLQVFFAQLDVVNSDAGCLGDAAEQCSTLFGIVSSEASAISDVAQQHRESIVVGRRYRVVRLLQSHRRWVEHAFTGCGKSPECACSAG